jgi:hypothetical protein
MEMSTGMEERLLVAYALSAIMILCLGLGLQRYLAARRQYKIRQMGRGKNNHDDIDETN